MRKNINIHMVQRMNDQLVGMVLIAVTVVMMLVILAAAGALCLESTRNFQSMKVGGIISTKTM